MSIFIYQGKFMLKVVRNKQGCRIEIVVKKKVKNEGIKGEKKAFLFKGLKKVQVRYKNAIAEGQTF